MSDDNIQNLNSAFPIRLDHFLSVAGVASRRKSAELVKAGNVTVNKRIVLLPGHRINKEDKVICHGHEITLPKCLVYIMLNKPKGYCCTMKDSHAEKRAIDLIQVCEVRLYNVGRLDKDSEGLLIFTNDGDYAAKLTHPRYGVTKTYEVTTDRFLSDIAIKRLCNGIEDKGEILKAVRIIRKTDRKYIFVMSEGKKREIRRLLENVGINTNRLKRIAIGGLLLGSLSSGEWRFLNRKEIQLSLKANQFV